MIPSDKAERKRMIERMVVSCSGDFDKLNKWEQDFVDSILAQYDEKHDLTDRQCEILEKIYDKL